MKNHDKSKKSSYIQYCHAKSLYAWAMCQKLPEDCFKWEKNIVKFNDDMMNNDEDGDKGYIFEVHIRYPKDLHSDLPFLSKRMKIDKSDKLICNF